MSGPVRDYVAAFAAPVRDLLADLEEASARHNDIPPDIKRGAIHAHAMAVTAQSRTPETVLRLSEAIAPTRSRKVLG